MNARQHLFGLRTVRRLVLVSLLALSFLSGCATPSQDPYLYTGAGLGGLLGAGIGAAANHNNPWRGAAIGGLLGAGGGGIAGELYGRSQAPPAQSYYGPPPQGYSYGPPQGYGYAPPPPPSNGYY